MEGMDQPVFMREHLLEIRSKYYANEKKVYLDKIMKNITKDVKEGAKTETKFNKTYYINHTLFTSIPDLYTRLYTCFPDSYVTIKVTDDNTLFRERMKAVNIKIDWTAVFRPVNFEAILQMIDSHVEAHDKAVEAVESVKEAVESVKEALESVEPVEEAVEQAQPKKKTHKPLIRNII